MDNLWKDVRSVEVGSIDADGNTLSKAVACNLLDIPSSTEFILVASPIIRKVLL